MWTHKKKEKNDAMQRAIDRQARQRFSECSHKVPSTQYWGERPDKTKKEIQVSADLSTLPKMGWESK